MAATNQTARRRAELLRAAFAVVAERGLGGLRTREVAARAGITHATLHHYFPGKQDLVRAVVEYAIQERILGYVPVDGLTGTGHQRVTALLAALHRHVHQDPAVHQVLQELSRHANQDATVREALRARYLNWHRYLTGLLAAGVEDGSIRPDVDPAAMATLLITVGLGLSVQAPLVADPAAGPESLGQLGLMLAAAPVGAAR